MNATEAYVRRREKREILNAESVKYFDLVANFQTFEIFKNNFHYIFKDT